MAKDPKTRRLQLLPEKIANLITLPADNDFITFRDTIFYNQLAGETYTSLKWPDLPFGLDENDVIQVNIASSDQGLITTRYLSYENIESHYDGDLMKHIVAIDPGTVLRDIGFRRGRFTLNLSFQRLMSGGPFPLLVNSKEKIYIGNYTVDDATGYFYAADENVQSETVIDDRLYVKENKLILKKISSNRKEIILSPNFINDDAYLERFRLAAYHCLNWFPDIDAGTTVTFESETSNLINFNNMPDGIPSSFINGTIRINDAYYLGKRIIPETSIDYEVIPEVSLEPASVNLLKGNFLDSIVGWKTHSPYPDAESVNSLSDSNRNATRIETVVEPNPAGSQAVKHIIQTTLNDGASIQANYSFGLAPYLKIDPPLEGEIFTYSVYCKAPEGVKLRLQAHSGAWGTTGTTVLSPSFDATGKWQRLKHTFVLTNTSSENRITLRNIVNPNGKWNPESNIAVGRSILWAGAQLVKGSFEGKFTRNESYTDNIEEIAETGTIQFVEPDGYELHAELSPTDDGFKQAMIGSQLQIIDAIAIDDLSSEFQTADIDKKDVFDPPPQMPKSDETGTPGTLATYYDWDPGLHHQAIRTVGADDVENWAPGFNHHRGYKHYRHAGTSTIGYHAHWIKNGGENEDPCMYFPDLNYQDYILEPMRAAAYAAWSDPTTGYYLSREMEDPRIANQIQLSESWKHRWLGICSLDATIGPLASFGIKEGDTLRLSWKQKSLPTNPDYDHGGRKGANFGIMHYYNETYISPETPYVSNAEIEAEELEIGSGDYIDADAFDASASSVYPTGLTPEDFGGVHVEPPTPYPTEVAPYQEPTQEGERSQGDNWVGAERELTEEEEREASNTEGQYASYVLYWEPSGPEGWAWDETSDQWVYQGDLGFEDEFSIPGISENGTYWYAFGFTWTNVGQKWLSNYELAGGVFQAINPSTGLLEPVENYPSYDDFPTEANLSLDGKFKWNGTRWTYNDVSAIVEENEPNSEGMVEAHVKRRTFDLTPKEGGGHHKARKTVKCDEYNEWELASAQWTISPEFSLKDPINIYVYGHYTGFGELWVDQVKLEVILTSAERTIVDQSAKLAPLILEIGDVLSRDTVEVTETYVDAAADQGGVASNFPINQHSIFDKGFKVGFVSIPEEEQLIHARYEGKILDVINDAVGGGNKIIVDKTYQEYGGEVAAISGSENSPDISTPFSEFFTRYRLNDPDNLYTQIVFGPEKKSLVVNFKPVATEDYPGSIAYVLSAAVPDGVELFDTAYIVKEVTPELVEKVDLNPFIDEQISEVVLKTPNLADVDNAVSDRQTEYATHTDLVGKKFDVRKELEDKILSGSIEDVAINVDYTKFKNFSHFGSVEKRLENFKYKLGLIEQYTAYSQSLAGDYYGDTEGFMSGSETGSMTSGSGDQAEKWNMKKRQQVNSFDDFENYMYFKSSSYVSSSNGYFYDNAAPKVSGDGTLINPYALYSVSSSQFTSWYDEQLDSGSMYDRTNSNRLVNLVPSHITYDNENVQFITFLDMIGHHYDIIWTHVKSLTDVHDRSEDITRGISAQLVQPVAQSLGFPMVEGRDLARLPQYHLGLAESGSGTGIFNVRFTKRSQKEVTREIWNRILSTMPYLLKSKGTKQSLKALIAAYGIPTSILRIQEYGGPKIAGGAPEFELKERHTKALRFNGGQKLESPWYNNELTGRASDTIEFRFKTGVERDTMIATKNNPTENVEAVVHLINVSGSDTKGKLTLTLSGSEGYNSASLNALPFYNNEYWSVMIRRRTGTISSSYEVQSITDDVTPTTQSFDIFAGFYDSGVDEIITKASASMDISGSLLTNWYRTGSIVGDDTWHVGGKSGSAHEGTLYGSQLSGSVMEWRYWSTPLTESAFYNHTAAPKAVNGNHVSSSYYDMNLRFSMDDNTNLNADPHGIKDYSLTGGQVYATGSGFADEINFSNVSDRQKAFIPSIGLNKTSNKIRVESAKMTSPDGAVAVLSSTERVELSSYDTAPLDSNKLGIFFAPTDVINEDIILTLADLDFGSYLGDPRDTYADRYVHGRLDRVADTYWKKWTTAYTFWDYLKLIKYYDLSLFYHLRRLSPGRAKKNIGILIEPTILERPKVVQGHPPKVEDEYKTGTIHLTGSNLKWEYGYLEGEDIKKTGIYKHTYEAPLTSSQFPYNGTVADTSILYHTGSHEYRKGPINMMSYRSASSIDYMHPTEFVWSRGNESNTTSSRNDYETVSSSTSPFFGLGAMRQFGVNKHLDPLERDYTTGEVYNGGGGNIFFEILQPQYTASKASLFNSQKIYYYSSSLSASKFIPYSQSLETSEIESQFTSHVSLTRLAYDGCKEDGTLVPVGNQVAVEIIEVNPYDVTTTGAGDTYVDVSLSNE